MTYGDDDREYIINTADIPLNKLDKEEKILVMYISRLERNEIPNNEVYKFLLSKGFNELLKVTVDGDKIRCIDKNTSDNLMLELRASRMYRDELIDMLGDYKQNEDSMIYKMLGALTSIFY